MGPGALAGVPLSLRWRRSAEPWVELPGTADAGVELVSVAGVVAEAEDDHAPPGTAYADRVANKNSCPFWCTKPPCPSRRGKMNARSSRSFDRGDGQSTHRTLPAKRGSLFMGRPFRQYFQFCIKVHLPLRPHGTLTFRSVNWNLGRLFQSNPSLQSA